MQALRHIISGAVALSLLLGAETQAHPPRSASAKHQFRKANPCPTSSHTRGKCPGHVIDHVVPLCAGGADNPQNMQWQTVHDARVKDREEVRQCAAYRRAGNKP